MRTFCCNSSLFTKFIASVPLNNNFVRERTFCLIRLRYVNLKLNTVASFKSFFLLDGQTHDVQWIGKIVRESSALLQFLRTHYAISSLMSPGLLVIVSLHVYSSQYRWHYLVVVVETHRWVTYYNSKLFIIEHLGLQGSNLCFVTYLFCMLYWWMMMTLELIAIDWLIFGD